MSSKRVLRRDPNIDNEKASLESSNENSERMFRGLISSLKMLGADLEKRFKLMYRTGKIRVRTVDDVARNPWTSSKSP